MTQADLSFGQTIARARRSKPLSQKELAAMIVKEEDGAPISAQYLNDIEHNRRNPTSDHLIRQFAKALKLQEEILFFLAGKIPDDLRRKARDPAEVTKAFVNFRKALTKR